MAIIIPTEPVGFGTSSMIVVICPTCLNKAWAIIGKESAKTVCCSAIVKHEKKASEPIKYVTIAKATIVKRIKPDKDKRRKVQNHGR